MENQEDLLAKSMQDLREGGVLSQQLAGYQERPAQIELARTVAQALAQGVPAICEAGTGVGKSLAYLIPVVHSKKTAIISTSNKTLQEQLFYKDIPFVQRHIQPFAAALVKGVHNYLCLARLDKERPLLHMHSRDELQQLLAAIQQEDWNGEFDTLKGFHFPQDWRSRLATNSDNCTGSRCPFYADCYVYDMRDEAEGAQVIVVNHTLLLLDAASGGRLLPDREIIILDEAHHLEEEATRTFTVRVGPPQITALLSQQRVRNYTSPRLQNEILSTADDVWRHLEQVCSSYPTGSGKRPLLQPVKSGLHLAVRLETLGNELAGVRHSTVPAEERAQFDRVLRRITTLAEQARLIFSVSQPRTFVYYAERAPRQEGATMSYEIRAAAAPLSVAEWLRERLFKQGNAICVSATLATTDVQGKKGKGAKGATLAYFRRRVGLEQREALECILPPAFDYARHALLYLSPRGLPEPGRMEGEGSKEYIASIAHQMRALIEASQGRAFLLFSSKGMLLRLYEELRSTVDYPLLKQGDLPQRELVRLFRQEEGSILFGLKSFWEGVDITGDSLSLVVIDKLPFDPPDDPILKARIARMKALGENWFEGYILPQAVLRLKQGLGRLLRTEEDQGAMAILDPRLKSKSYGKIILDALYPCPVTHDLERVARFYQSLREREA